MSAPVPMGGGADKSIQSTFARVEPVFPYVSWNSKVKLPVLVKVYVSEPPLFVIVTGVDSFSRVATTFQEVITLGVYETVAIGGTHGLQPLTMIHHFSQR